jgi:FtsH-binding integral membrane protein
MEEVSMMDYGSKELEGELRLGFIRKVLGIVCAMLGVTVLMSFIVFIDENIKNYLESNPWVIFLSLAIYIICALVLICSKKKARKVPTNYILLFILTLCLSLITAWVTSQYEASSVLMALGLTLAVTLALCFYAVMTKTDFTTCWGLVLVFSVVSLIVLVLMLCMDDGGSLRYFYCWISVIFYGFYLIMDIQLIVGKGRHKLKHEDYIVGALMIYVDIIQIFLYLLEIFGSKKN